MCVLFLIIITGITHVHLLFCGAFLGCQATLAYRDLKEVYNSSSSRKPRALSLYVSCLAVSFPFGEFVSSAPEILLRQWAGLFVSMCVLICSVVSDSFQPQRL